MTSEASFVEADKQDSEHQALECNAQSVRRGLAAGLAWLEQHSEAINALNVFPVPDGDTGTNMVLTLRNAMKEANESSAETVGQVMKAVAHGALMGARGNSGVILSQLLRGLSQALQNAATLTPQLLGEAFIASRDLAYQAVMRPVEGTILTVAKEVATATARAARNENMDFVHLLSIAVDTARHAVAATPTQLPVLAEAGVVDAGGQGLSIILEGVSRYVNGMPVATNGNLQRQVDLVSVKPEQEYGYDTQMIIRGQGLDVEQIREVLSEMGDSLLVVGDSNTVKVHIHTDRPGNPLNYAVQLGSVSDVVIENMQEQYQNFIAQNTTQKSTKPAKQVGVVAVAQGEGFRRVLNSLGADVVVEGGQTMNPSIEELISAATSLPNEKVILLPNNKNVILAAQQARTITNKPIAVVPTRTVAEGISALLAYNYEVGLDENVASMSAASQQTQTLEVTIATRSATVNGLKVKDGQYIAILNTDLVAAGNDIIKVTLKALEGIETADYEIVTIYYGKDSDEEQSERLSNAIQKRYPDLEIEVVEGGQPNYLFVLAIE